MLFIRPTKKMMWRLSYLATGCLALDFEDVGVGVEGGRLHDGDSLVRRGLTLPILALRSTGLLAALVLTLRCLAHLSPLL